MKMREMKLIDQERMMIGIDGGGTKTEFVLFSESGRILQRVQSSTSNPNDIGIENCCQVLTDGIDTLMRCKAEITAIFAGISGGMTGDNGMRIYEYLKSKYPVIDIKVDTDAVNVISCVCKGDSGMALISGTGSVLFVREDGVLHRIGGWGYLFDESGSAYDVGKDAIRATLAELDGMGDRTMLTELLLKELKGNIWDCLSELYAKGKTYIAALAPLVFKAANCGDQVAQEIIRKNAEHLAKLINTAKKQYECGNEVVVGGGMIQNCRDVMVPIIEPLIPKDVCLVFPELPPIYGACVECCSMIGLVPNEKFYNNFYKDYKVKR